MPIKDITKVHEYVINKKKNREPITKTLERLGIPRSTYYKMIDKNGGKRWRDISEAKMVIKIEPPKKKGVSKSGSTNVKDNSREFKGLSGGSLQYTNENDDPPLQDMELRMKSFRKTLKKYDEYIK